MGQSVLSSQDHPKSEITTRIFTFYTEQEARQQYQHFKDLLNHHHHFQVPCEWMHFQHLVRNNQWKIIIGLKIPEVSLRKDFISRKKARNFYIEQQLKNILAVIICFLNEYQSIICSHLDIFGHVFLWKKQNQKIGVVFCSPQLLYGLCHKLQCQRNEQHFDKTLSLQKLKAKAIEQIFSLFLLEKIVLPNQSNIQQIHCIYLNKWHVDIAQSLTQITSQQFWGKTSEIANQLYQQLSTLQKQPKQPQILIIKDIQERQIRPFPKSSCKFKKSIKNNQTNEEYIPFKNQLKDYNRDVSESIIFSDSLQLAQSPSNPKQINSIALSGIDWINESQDSHNEDYNENSPQIFLSSSINQLHDIILQEQKESQDSNKNNKAKDQSFRQRVFSSEYLNSFEGRQVTIELEQGSCYQGFMKKGKKQGRGRLYFCDGGHYDGEWKQDEMHGFGQLYYPSGRLAYRGHWKQGQFHGLGIIYNEVPQEIEGSFDYSNFSRVGMKWRKYNGTFYEDKKHGQGVLFLSNGEKFQGIWNQNEVQGRGKFQTLSKELISGVWAANRLERQTARQTLQFTSDILQK